MTSNQYFCDATTDRNEYDYANQVSKKSWKESRAHAPGNVIIDTSKALYLIYRDIGQQYQKTDLSRAGLY